MSDKKQSKEADNRPTDESRDNYVEAVTSTSSSYATARSSVSLSSPSPPTSDIGGALLPNTERKSHFQLFPNEVTRAPTSDDDNDADADTDHGDHDADEEVEQEQKVTNFKKEIAASNRAKKLTKTKAEQGSSNADDTSSVEMPLTRSLDYRRSQAFNKAALSGTRSSSFNTRLTSNLDKGKIFIYVVVPPDGGYGWFIMVISFLCQVIVDGLIFSIGIVMPYMASDLQVTPAEIVLVVSIQVGCYFLSGPISSAAINKYGFRPVIITGSIASSLSVLIATFSPNLPMLIAFYSVIGGPTLSMIWVTSQLIIGYYFEKYRPIAYGISVSGAGAGIVVASALNSAVVDDLGWRNTLRIHAGLLIIILLMGLTFVEVPPSRVAFINEADFETETDDSEHLVGSTLRYSRVSMGHLAEASHGESSGLGISGGTTGLEQMLEEYEKPTPSRDNCCTRYCCCCCPQRRVSKDTEIPTHRLVVRATFLERQDVYYTGPADYQHTQQRNTVVDGRQIEIDNDRRNTQYTLSVLQSGPRLTQEHRKTLVELKKTSRCPHLAFINPSNWLPAKMVNALKLLFDVNLLAMSEFQILLASALFFPMGFNIPFVYSKVRAEVPTQYQNLISPSIGFSNFVFRIISGVIAFKFREYTTYVCGFGLIFGGLATFISAFYGTNIIWFQFVYATCYGVAPAFFSTLRAIIYVKALGLEKLTNAFGLTGVAMGLGVFIGTTLAGILNEETDTYVASFAFGGCCMIIAGLLKVLLPSFIYWKAQRLANLRKVQFTPS